MPSPQDIALMNKDYSNKLYNTKTDQTNSQCIIGIPSYLSNNNYRGVFSKGFQHLDSKSPDPVAYATFLEAVKDKNVKLLYSIVSQNPKLIDPYCLLDSELIGIYRSSIVIPNSPEPTSAQAAAEMLEVYAMALSRDIPFDQWSTDTDIANIVSYLNLVKNDLGAPVDPQTQQITPATLFRGPTVGDLIGPYLSQFLLLDAQMGSFFMPQKYQSADPEVNYLTTVPDFLSKWSNPTPAVRLIGDSRYLITPRDCANYIHLDFPWQPFYVAASVLLKNGIPFSFTTTNRVGGKFINLGAVDLFNLMSEAGKLGMNSTWMYKWCQMRYRPEEMAYQIHLKKTEGNGLNFPASLLNNEILNLIFAQNGNYLCSQAYPEGCPNHPAYPSGHATLAGAMVTILKAFFKCDATLQAKIPSSDGSTLENLIENGQQVVLKVGDELNKLACNCAAFRCFAGIHYRADMNGMYVGEQVAIQLLQEMSTRYEGNVTFSFKKFDGSTVKISNNKA